MVLVVKKKPKAPQPTRETTLLPPPPSPSPTAPKCSTPAGLKHIACFGGLEICLPLACRPLTREQTRGWGRRQCSTHRNGHAELLWQWPIGHYSPFHEYRLISSPHSPITLSCGSRRRPNLIVARPRRCRDALSTYIFSCAQQAADEMRTHVKTQSSKNNLWHSTPRACKLLRSSRSSFLKLLKIAFESFKKIRKN
jgi:hypothetical protein